MKLDLITKKQDEFYTPAYAITPLLKYLQKSSNVWCPFDTEQSNFVKLLDDDGHKVTYSHIGEDGDFFQIKPNDDTDYIISNPPYSIKGQILSRLFELGVPFAMLVGVVGLFESQDRFNMFKNNDFEIMYLNRRVAYFRDYGEPKPSLNPPFSSVYITHKVLPKQIVFEEIDKTGRGLTRH